MDRREKIYKQALALFNKHGYDNTSTSKIADALHISKAGLYHYISSKQHLLFLIHEDYMKKHFIPILEGAEKLADPEKRITYFIQNYATLLAQDASARVLIHETKRLEPKYRKEIKRVWRRVFHLIRDSLTEMQASKKGKKLNSAFSAFALIGMVSWTFYWFDYARKGSGKELSETFSEIFLRGFLKGSD